MHIKRIHEMEEKLTEIALCEINKGIECVNTAEMGAVIDMIKDLACAEKEAREAKEMEKEEEDEKKENEYFLKMLKEEYGDEEGERRFYDNYRYKSSGRFAPKGKGSYMPRGGRRGYEEPPYYHMNPDYRMDLEDYKGKTAEELRDMDRHTKGVMYYTEPIRMDGMREMHDRKDGKSWEKRRGYMETKELHKDGSPESKQHRMKDLEMYAKDLTEDVVDMIADATPEERALLKQKMQVLIQKIG